MVRVEMEEACCWICLERGPAVGGASSARAVATRAPAGGALEKLCACPSRYVHRKCLARWQLQCAGTLEEHACRFCQCELPCWRRSLAASLSMPEAPVIRRRACAPRTPSSGGGGGVGGADAAAAATPPTTAAAAAWGRLFRGRGGGAARAGGAQGPVIALHLNSRTCHIEVPPGCTLESFKASVRRRLGLAPNQSFDLNFLIELEPGEKVMLKGVTRSPANFEAAVFCATLSAARRTRGGWGGGGGAAAAASVGRGWRLVVAAVSGAVAKTRAALHRGRRQRARDSSSTARRNGGRGASSSGGRGASSSGDEGPGSSSAAAAADATVASRPVSGEFHRPVSPAAAPPTAVAPAAPLAAS